MSFFSKNLSDLVKGIRNSGNDSTAFIAKSIQEIKEELKGRDVAVKAEALKKLIYLKMLGNDMSWAAFHVIEVMSQDRFNLKRTGFLAAAQSFTSTTDVLLLCVQLLKKEFTAKSGWEIGTAINTLACIATEDLSRDLLGDVVQMLTSSRVYIKKKAALVLYKMYCAYPQGLRLTFDNLKRTLSDDSPSVVSCAVNVIAELARKKPSNYLNLAPEFFALLTTSSSNWMLIKVIKLLASLVGEEPRLARKLLEPLATLIQTSGAKSVQYEAIACVTVALQHTKKADGTDAKNVPTVVRLCTDRLRELVRDPDQNLKYLGLVGLVGLMKSHPRVVAEHRELVLACLLDEDVTIRLRALELVCGMCTRRNLGDIVESLLGQVESAEGHWRTELIDKIIFMCSRDKYAYLSDFAWYVEVLARLAGLDGGAHHASTVAGQLLDVTVRVEDVRPTAMSKLIPMLADANFIKNARMGGGPSRGGGGGSGGGEGGEGGDSSSSTAATTSASGSASPSGVAPPSDGAGGFEGSGAILAAAAWIVGEFCAIIPASLHGGLMDDLLAPAVATLPPQLQASYVQCLLKVVSASAAAAGKAGGMGQGAFLASMAALLPRLNTFAQSSHVEVQERAFLTQQLLSTLGVPFTPLETPASLAAAKAAAEEEMLSLASGGPAVAAVAAVDAGGSASPSKAAQAASSRLPPLDPDLKLISAVLSSLFAEALKPVNSKAQKRVPVPGGLDLNAIIVPGFTSEGPGGAAAAMNPAYVSFEDSYGLDDDDFAGTSGGGGGGKGKKGKGSKGGQYDMSGGGDEEDEAWFKDMQKKNKKRDHELWGTGEEEEEEEAASKKGKKGSKKGGSSKGSSKGGSGDPFLLGSSRSRSATEDVDSIPIKTLAPGELGEGGKKKPLLDASIFGDMGGGSSSKKKGVSSSSKGKKSKGGGDDDAPLGAGRPRVISDEDFPKGGKGDDDDDERGGKMSKMADALSNIDLSTPLGDDEVLHAPKHRSVADPAALRGAGSKKSGGRARVLGGGGAAAPAVEEEKSSKKDKKKSSSKEEEAPKKKSSKDKEEESPKKKSSSKDKEAAAAVPEKKEKKSKAAAAPSPISAPDLASVEPYLFPLGADKVVKVALSASGTCVATPGSTPSTSPCFALTLGIRLETKSSKKTIEWVEGTLSGGGEGLTLVTGEFAAGSTSGGFLRLLGSIKPKEKGNPKIPAKRATFPAVFTSSPTTPLTFTLTLAYKCEGSDKVVTLEPMAVSVPTPSLLQAVAITPEDYKALMTSAGATFEGAVGSVPFLPATPAGGAAAGGLEGSLTAVCGMFRAVAVARSPKHAILYGKAATPAGEGGSTGNHVTVLIREDPEKPGAALSLTVKSQVSLAHAEGLLAAVVAAMAEAVKAASKGEEKE